MTAAAGERLSCRHFGTCGGCSSLDVPGADQLAAKVARVRAVLAPIAANVAVEAAVPERPSVHDRMKLLYPVQPGQGGARLAMGIYARGTHDVVRIGECRVQARALTTLARRAERIFAAHRMVPYDERTHTGFLRAFQARLMPGTGELLMGIVTLAGELRDGAGLADRLIDAAADLRDARGRRVTTVGVIRNVNDERGNALLGSESLALRGRDYQVDRAGELRFRVSFSSFYQVHRHTDRLLYETAMEMIGPVEGQRVVDGYGGVGCFAVRLAARGAAAVDLIESHPAACRDARTNAQTNDTPQVRVIEAAFADAPPVEPPDLVVVDPPRSGLREAGVARLLQLAPQRILLVACSIRSLGEDLGRLVAAGYRVATVRLADLFPHTDHVEVLTLLERQPARRVDASPC